MFSISHISLTTNCFFEEIIWYNLLSNILSCPLISTMPPNPCTPVDKCYFKIKTENFLKCKIKRKTAKRCWIQEPPLTTTLIYHSSALRCSCSTLNTDWGDLEASKRNNSGQAVWGSPRRMNWGEETLSWSWRTFHGCPRRKRGWGKSNVAFPTSLHPGKCISVYCCPLHLPLMPAGKNRRPAALWKEMLPVFWIRVGLMRRLALQNE